MPRLIGREMAEKSAVIYWDLTFNPFCRYCFGKKSLLEEIR